MQNTQLMLEIWQFMPHAILSTPVPGGKIDLDLYNATAKIFVFKFLKVFLIGIHVLKVIIFKLV